MEPTLKEKLHYRFENFMAKGGISIFISLIILFILCFVVAGLLRGIILLFFPDSGMGTALDHMWTIFLEMTDPGSMSADDESPGRFKFAAVITGLLGVVIFSMLIAFITTQLDAVIETFKKGQSKVLEKNQTLILGWSDRVVDIIKELTIANESEEDAVVVVLAEKPKVEMDDIILEALPDTKTTRVITRRGSPTSLTALRRVAAKEAKSAIILSRAKENDPEELKRNSDARVLKSILALISCQGGKNKMSIVADLLYESNRQLLQTFESNKINAIDSSDILAKILVQTSRTTGLAMVYNEILSFSGCELYYQEGRWEGMKFSQLAFHLEDGVPLGIKKKDGSLILRPSKETIMEKEDDLLLIAEDDSSITFSKEPVITPKELPFEYRKQKKQVERELILGWHSMTRNIIREYTEYLVEGATVDLMISKPSEKIINEIVSIQEENPSLTINPLDMDPMSMEDLKRIDPFSYDNIIILSQSERRGSPEQVDSETLFILLLLRKILAESGIENKKTTLITQVMNSENQELITQTNVDDFLISNKIVTMIFAQLSEEAEIRKVYDNIFSESGSEIYLKPAQLYFEKLPVTVRFADLLALASKRDEVCLGIRLGEHAYLPDKNFGITLDPKKDMVYTLDDDDSLVVLAEDEL